jgi:MerR family transcriptional regulator, heat shock protein HspR
VVRKRGEQNRPLYMISVAAELAGVHPQTLRIYERKQLVAPQRSAGNTRLYSQADVERLRFIHQLTQIEGVNLAGVERIIELQRQIEAAQAELEATVDRLRRVEAVAQAARESVRELSRRQEARGALVRIDYGPVVRRQA